MRRTNQSKRYNVGTFQRYNVPTTNRRQSIELEVLVSTIHRPLDDKDGVWNLHTAELWSVAPGDAAHSDSTHSDEAGIGSAEGLVVFDYDDMDMREFDGDEPEMAELGL